MFAQKYNNDNSIFHQPSLGGHLLINVSAKDQQPTAKCGKQKLTEMKREIYINPEL